MVFPNTLPTIETREREKGVAAIRGYILSFYDIDCGFFFLRLVYFTYWRRRSWNPEIIGRLLLMQKVPDFGAKVFFTVE